MCYASHITISNIPEISAIYFALLQCGYDYYSIERSQEHNDYVRSFIGPEDAVPFFSGARQNTCEVYPYWPRAAILETASFYLSSDHTKFRDYGAFRNRIMGAANIADNERDQRLWDWIESFPVELTKILACDAFRNYLKWEQKWLITQNVRHEAELRVIKDCQNVCVSKYDSPVHDIQIVINPIKCVYSADYHLDKDCFVFCSGAFRAESVIHELLHHVVHPAILEIASLVLESKQTYPGIDKSYYLSGGEAGQLNAFEEYAVRELTKDAVHDKYPLDIASYLRELL